MSTPILLLNCGSSSVKYQVIDADTEDVVASGIIQRIGESESTLDHNYAGQSRHDVHGFPNHARALAHLVRVFGEVGPDLAEVVAVGHRTVHGGSAFRSTVVIDDTVLDKLRELSPLAPLHNPPGIAGIEAARAVLPDVPHVAVFDTAFFSTLPPEAYTYAIDTELAHRHGVRKYGFHGTSHSFVSKRTAEFLGRVAVDTSMGLTPLAGLVMGTRSGDVDPGLHAFLGRALGVGLDEVDTLLNKKSGMLGLCGVTDFRDIADLITSGDEAAELAMGVYVHRMVSYIGSYLAVLGRVDTLVFTAGIGENDDDVRARVVSRLEPLGFQLDPEVNRIRSKQPRVISRPGSPVTVLVVPTNEELAMARETIQAIGS
jgi:acetate kinase